MSTKPTGIPYPQRKYTRVVIKQVSKLLHPTTAATMSEMTGVPPEEPEDVAPTVTKPLANKIALLPKKRRPPFRLAVKPLSKPEKGTLERDDNVIDI